MVGGVARGVGGAVCARRCRGGSTEAPCFLSECGVPFPVRVVLECTGRGSKCTCHRKWGWGMEKTSLSPPANRTPRSKRGRVHVPRASTCAACPHVHMPRVSPCPHALMGLLPPGKGVT